MTKEERLAEKRYPQNPNYKDLIYPHDALIDLQRCAFIAGYKTAFAEKDKEICDLLDWGNSKDEALEKLEAKIKDLQNAYMGVQAGLQQAQFVKENKNKDHGMES